uniref:F-box domain-containing protein n=1 Tax=Davidia involucrata TaxID=16924 RepID=A0A5B7AX73_DAVIN
MAEPETSNDESSTTVNELPVRLLLHILSYLPTLEAIQTTTLSRKWRDLWTSLPSLSFDYTLFPPYDSPSQTLSFFAHFINRTLILRSHSDLLNLYIRFKLTPELHLYKYHFDSWIRYAINHNVNHLSLNFYSKYIRQFHDPENDIVYHFPFSALRNGRVCFLFLKRCNLILPIDAPQTRFETLRSIFLEQVYLTDDMVSDMVSGCLNLESLLITRCCGMKNVKISSSRLTNLGLWHLRCDEGSIDISAPKLRKLTILFSEVGKYVLEETSALVEARVCFIHKAENYVYWSKVMKLLGHVKRLSTQNWGFKLVAAKDLFSGSFLFYNLNYLELTTEYSKSDLLGIAALLEISPNLETMILEPNLKLDEEIFEKIESEEFKIINFNLPRLKNLRINCYRGTEGELYFLKLVLKNEVVLERIVLDPVPMCKTPVTPIVLVKQPQGFQVLR